MIGAHWVGGQKGPRVVVDVVDNSKILVSLELSTAIPQSFSLNIRILSSGNKMYHLHPLFETEVLLTKILYGNFCLILRKQQ
jgi:hypothetical protein